MAPKGSKTAPPPQADNATSAPVVLGIDFGTTHSSVGVWQNGRAEIIANEQGFRSTPMVIGFSENELLIGEAAEAKMYKNAANTVFDIKRFLGKKFEDESIQYLLKQWPFRVIPTEEGYCGIVVTFQGKEKTFSPEELVAIILRRLKKQAEDYLGKQISNAVIAVPAGFTEMQRQSIMNAAKQAKLKVSRLIDEASSAVVAYGLDRKNVTQRNVLVFDLGGGTLGVSLISITDGLLSLDATHGDHHLGGEDFDVKLVEHFAKDFQRKTRADISDNQRAIQRLRTACERAKRILSQQTQASVDIDSLYDGMDFSSRITRARFEDLIFDFVKKARVHVEQVLSESGLDAEDIDDVLLVGGASRVPKIQSMLESIFGASKIKSTVNPEDVVGLGATIQASILAGNGDEDVAEFSSMDIVPLSIGVEAAGGVMVPIIERLTSLPVVKRVTCSTSDDHQTSIFLKIYEGERTMAEDNTLIAQVAITDIPLMPRGAPVIEVKLSLDVNGGLHVSAVESSTEKKVTVQIKADPTRLTHEDVEAIVDDAFAVEDEDLTRSRQAEARVELEYAISKNLGAHADDSAITSALHGDQEWLKANPDASEESLNSKLAEVQRRVQGTTLAEPAVTQDDITETPAPAEGAHDLD